MSFVHICVHHYTLLPQGLTAFILYVRITTNQIDHSFNSTGMLKVEVLQKSLSITFKNNFLSRFLSFRWFHHVHSQGRNLAVNIWFVHNMYFNRTSCEQQQKDLPEFVPLSQFKMASTSEQIRWVECEFMMDNQFIGEEKGMCRIG